jgi:hypothetical protein
MELAVGDTCEVTKAGKWRLDGKIVKINADSTIDVSYRTKTSH